MEITLELDEEIQIEFADEGVTTSALVSMTEDGLFRIESVPLFVESATYGDVIRALAISSSRLRFIDVARPGGWRVWTYVVPAGWRGSDVQLVVDEAVSRGAHWENLFGGLLFICIPPECDWEPPESLRAAARRHPIPEK